LITALLLADWQKHGSIDLKAFWARRARRLLPALFLTLAGTLVLTTLLLPLELAGLTRGMPAAVGYVTNWYLIASRQSYFDAVERPALLQHLWSLAIEEQFYIL
jgi:peptidoglycan/LPS O-acetylase OafA/YrhL